MKRTAIIVAALAALVGAGGNFYYFGIRPDERYSLWLVLVPSGVLFCIACALFIWATSDNIYNVKSGKVVAHDFTAAHMTPAIHIPGVPGTATTPGTPATYIPAHWVDDDWAIQLEDENGRTGWLHFSKDVFKQHPIGSWYGQRK